MCKDVYLHPCLLCGTCVYVCINLHSLGLMCVHACLFAFSWIRKSWFLCLYMVFSMFFDMYILYMYIYIYIFFSFFLYMFYDNFITLVYVCSFYYFLFLVCLFCFFFYISNRKILIINDNCNIK